MRIIHRFDFKGLDVVKGINFEGLRPIAKIENLIRAWNRNRIMELHLQGALTSLHSTILNYDIVRIAKETLLRPVTVGGGIKNLSTAQKLINNGADRIGINTAFFENSDLYEILASALGVSSVVVTIDVSKINKHYYCFINNGRDNTGILLEDYIFKYNKEISPEILVTNIDLDGTCKGIDIELLNILSQYKGPVIISGGISSIENILSIKKIINNCSSGVSIGRAFHNKILKEKKDFGKEFAFASHFDMVSYSTINSDNFLEPSLILKEINK